MGRSRTSSITVSTEIKKYLDDMKIAESQMREVTWNEFLERISLFYSRKTEIDAELNRLQRAVEEIAMNLSTSRAPSPAPISYFSRPPGNAGPSLPPPPGTRQSTPVPTQNKLHSDMVNEMKTLFKEKGRNILKTLREVREEELKRAVNEFGDDDLASEYPSVVKIADAIVNVDRNAKFKNATGAALLAMKNAYRDDVEELRGDIESLRLAAIQDPDFIKTEISEKRGSEGFVNSISEVLNSIKKIRSLAA